MAAMKLPNGERADLGTKLEDYSLNTTHRQGQHKARVFASALGITLANKGVLAAALLRAAAASDQAEFRGNNGLGDTYVLRFRLETDEGAATVLSGWIVRQEEDFPRLTTCFIV